MPTYLDLLPDGLYQMIMRPTYDNCVEEVVRRRDLRHRHRTLQGYWPPVAFPTTRVRSAPW